MNRNKYDDEFKLEVVKAYLESTLGVRALAKSYGLPSKNYIHRWLEELKRKGLIDSEATKKSAKSSMAPRPEPKSSPPVYKKSAREKQLEKENLRLRAENEFLKKLQELERRGFQDK